MKMIRYKTTPLTLYLLQYSRKFVLKEKAEEEIRSSFYYNYVIGPDNMYHPTEGDIFTRPNGYPLYPLGASLQAIASAMTSATFIFEVPKEIRLPEDLVVIHERKENYSLQFERICNIKDF